MQALRDDLEHPDGHVSAQVREPLEQEPPRGLDAPRVGPPVLEAVVAEALDDVQPLGRADVPMALLLSGEEGDGGGGGSSV